MDFAQLLEMLRNPGEDGTPDTIYDDLSAAYTNDTSTRDAKIETSTAELDALRAELLAAKAANWDLVQQIPVADSGETTDDVIDDDSDNPESDDDDDFFE